MKIRYLNQIINTIATGWGKIRTGLCQALTFLMPNRTLKITFWLALGLPLFLVFIYALVLPLLTFPNPRSLFNQLPAASDSTQKQKKITRFEAKELLSKWLALKTEAAYLKSALEVAKGDSIYLALDLRDSTLALAIKGVPIRSCKLQAFKICHGIQYLKSSGLLPYWLEPPFVLQQQWASITKIPIQIKKAPKDTTEASQSVETPEPVKPHDVHIKLKYNRGLTVYIDQIQSLSFRSVPRKIFYWLKSSASQLADSIANLVHLRPFEIQLCVFLEISQADAQAIYRAIPRNANLIVKF